MIEFFLKLRKPTPIIKSVSYRKTHSIDSAAFSEDIKEIHFNAPSISDLVTQYKTSVTSALDTNAPEITKTVVLRPNTEWYNANLRRAKTVRR